MAHYLVIAKPKSERLEKLEQQLERRSFETMKPFGRALTYSLNNARLRANAQVFNAAVEEIAEASRRLLGDLVVRK